MKLFTQRIGFSRTWARVQALAFLALFGTSCFSFRYYALSTTPQAYVAFLAASIAFLDLLDGDRKAMLRIAAFSVVIAFNHAQCLVFLGLFVGCAATLFYCKRRGWRLSTPGVAILVAAWVSSMALSQWALSSSSGLLDGTRHLKRAVDLGLLTRFGITQVWNLHAQYFETLGVHGLIGLGCAWFFRRRHPLVAAIVLSPILLLIFPPFAVTAFAQVDAEAVYRILYAGPTSFALVLGLREIFEDSRFRKRLGQFQGAAPALALLVIAALGIFPSWPWRGRLWFAGVQTPAPLELSFLYESSDWFLRNGKLHNNCLILSDMTTQFGVSTLTGVRSKDVRWTRTSGGEAILDLKALNHMIKIEKVCGVLLADLSQVPPMPKSTVGRISGHWPEDAAHIRRYLRTEFIDLAHGLEKIGWSAADVPPFYKYYEPPNL